MKAITYARAKTSQGWFERDRFGRVNLFPKVSPPEPSPILNEINQKRVSVLEVGMRRSMNDSHVAISLNCDMDF